MLPGVVRWKRKQAGTGQRLSQGRGVIGVTPRLENTMPGRRIVSGEGIHHSEMAAYRATLLG